MVVDSDLIDIDLLVVAAVFTVLVELDVVIDTLVAVPVRERRLE